MAVTLWHNPRCSKSRAALALLQNRGVDVVIRRYLEDAPARAELDQLQTAMGAPAIKMMRAKDPVFRDMGLSPEMDDDTLLTAMAQNPKLIERPVALHAGRAVIGRPPERVLDLL